MGGTVSLAGLEYKPEGFLGSLKMDADMKLDDRQFTIRKGKIHAPGCSLFFAGDYDMGERPHLKIRLAGSGMDLNQMVSKEAKPSKGFLGWIADTKVFSKGSGEVEVKINRFVRNHWTFPEIAGRIVFDNQTIQTDNLEIGQPGIDRMNLKGKLILADVNRPAFEGIMVSRNTRIESLFAIFGGLFRAGITGENVFMRVQFKSQGSDLTEVAKNLQGRWSFDIQKGRINTGHLLNGAALLFDVPVSPKTFEARANQFNNGYLRVFGDFPITNGVGHTKSFMYEDKGDRVTFTGDIDLYRQNLNLLAGLAPFRRVSRWLEKIPVLGPIVTGGREGSLITNYFEVEGPFSDPRIESIPWTSIGKKVLGTLEGVITAPADLIPKPDSGRK